MHRSQCNISQKDLSVTIFDLSMQFAAWAALKNKLLVLSC